MREKIQQEQTSERSERASRREHYIFPKRQKHKILHDSAVAGKYIEYTKCMYT